MVDGRRPWKQAARHGGRVFQQAPRRPRDLNSDASAETIFGWYYLFEALNAPDDPVEAEARLPIASRFRN